MNILSIGMQSRASCDCLFIMLDIMLCRLFLVLSKMTLYCHLIEASCIMLSSSPNITQELNSIVVAAGCPSDHDLLRLPSMASMTIVGTPRTPHTDMELL